MVIFVDLEANSSDQESEAVRNLSGVNPHSLASINASASGGNDPTNDAPSPSRPSSSNNSSSPKKQLQHHLDCEHEDVVPDNVDEAGLQDQPRNDADDNDVDGGGDDGDDDNSEDQVNGDNGLIRIMNCYPVVATFARLVDINTLDSLSLSCKQLYYTLTPSHKQLSRLTLRCTNDSRPSSSTGMEANDDSWASLNTDAARSRPNRCVRDMVEECMGCRSVICRNCIAKPLSKPRTRCRRLCATCLAQPISTYAHESFVPRSYQAGLCPQSMLVLFDDMFCKCQEVTWLCSRCRRVNFEDDTMYITQAGTEGSLRCARRTKCFAAVEKGRNQVVKMNGYVIAERSDDGGNYDSKNSNDNDNDDDDDDDDGNSNDNHTNNRNHDDSGVDTRVGAEVHVSPEERELETAQMSEATGKRRGWCGWCDRLIPDNNDRASVEAGFQFL